ncbi:YraN family protein [Phaeobacter sp. J2-8]|uniref:YraN family protein n=1 Tax=Phaeobacter sp. J2-8 TaxID=2931394 RepID=UPI001FD1837D|nr:YraN family protein [Phaeobacter sp. J2-8]MCJ7872681.1 YraN family protein [Phaeobacter sp. J2-8]
MPLDCGVADIGHVDVGDARARRGRRNQLAGVSAEGSIERAYVAAGHRVLARRWRARGGEIDLILQDGNGTYVFAEVKKSATFDRALARITPQQVARIHAAAEVFLGDCPQGLLSDVRFDAALVDSMGQTQILKGALLGY